VTGEETGMFGSRYYVANPLFPLDKTIACINLDMVGRVFEPRDTVWKTSPKMVKDFDGIFALSGKENPWLVDISDAVCQQLGLIPDKSLPSNFLRSSDHYQFYSKGVPILNYATGYHADYHKPTDEVSKINFQKMKRVADLCFEVGSRVTNLQALPADPSKNNKPF
jgi:Zn-dependent M28 family amino/carboxypeptidase